MRARRGVCEKNRRLVAHRNARGDSRFADASRFRQSPQANGRGPKKQKRGDEASAHEQHRIDRDGANYHSSKLARDRDRLRQDVFEILNWKICRVWSTDWYRDPDASSIGWSSA